MINLIKLTEYMKKKEHAKRIYLDYLASDEPHEEKWKVFCEYSREFGEKKDFVQHFESEKPFGGFNYESAPFNLSKFQEVFILDINKKINYHDFKTFAGLSEFMSEKKIWQQEVMSMNLYSFHYRW